MNVHVYIAAAPIIAEIRAVSCIANDVVNKAACLKLHCVFLSEIAMRIKSRTDQYSFVT